MTEYNAAIANIDAFLAECVIHIKDENTHFIDLANAYLNHIKSESEVDRLFLMKRLHELDIDMNHGIIHEMAIDPAYRVNLGPITIFTNDLRYVGIENKRAAYKPICGNCNRIIDQDHCVIFRHGLSDIGYMHCAECPRLLQG
jgi:hypothetical protein